MIRGAYLWQFFSKQMFFFRKILDVPQKSTFFIAFSGNFSRNSGKMKPLPGFYGPPFLQTFYRTTLILVGSAFRKLKQAELHPGTDIFSTRFRFIFDRTMIYYGNNRKVTCSPFHRILKHANAYIFPKGWCDVFSKLPFQGGLSKKTKPQKMYKI